ncbi:MAG: metal-dependent transcriptional regulator [Oscillospiraceae bacterium]|nr:metal-dependent transcriptional regulator [Oscillospiraceae bacterium]
MNLHESGEMYIETIYVLTRENPNIRAIDVGERMGFSKPSVSRALGILKQGGYVTVSPEGFLSLTESGIDVAEKIYARHELLKNFLVSIGVDEETAAEDACKMEHAISDTSFEAMKRHLNN